jgi:cytochrome P450
VDTTAIALTYIVYQLAKHPGLISELAKEVSRYNSIDDMKFTELEKLPLLNAVIRECLRMYPTVPAPIGRVCPPQGTTIGGYAIPGGVLPKLRSR